MSENKKNKNSEIVPHYGVYTRIGPSKIHGVGVIAIKDIKKGIQIFYGDEETKIVWIKKEQLKRIPKEIMKLYDDFCIEKEDGKLYGCPVNFNVLTPSWYLNHSKKPNVVADTEYNFYALKNIKKEEELTVDYETFNESLIL
jgi:SET domain-containing protein